MRTFRIDFTQDRPCLDGCFMGRIGEHNATEVVIIPPAILAKNKATTNYVIAFATGGMVIHSEPLKKAETVSVPLWQQLTQHPVIGIQLEAYDDAGEFIGKSEYVSGLRFLPSADGKDVPSDTDNPDFVSMYLKTKHSHENKETLDKFSEDKSGNLLYDNKPIEGGSSSGAGLTEEQAAALEANTAARHAHDNKEILDRIKKVQISGAQRYVFDEGYGALREIALRSDLPPALSTDWVANILNNPDAQGSVREFDHITTAGLRLISEKIADVNKAISAQTHWRFELVETLPETGAENIIYLAPNSSTGSNIYDEYIFVNDAFEIIGSTAINLSNCVTKEEFEEFKSSLGANGIDGASGFTLKSKYYANDWETGVIQTDSYGYQSIEFEIFEQLPNNAVVYDIGFEYDGKVYLSNEATQAFLLGSDAAVHIYGKPIFSEDLGTSLICTIVDNDTDDTLYDDLINGKGKFTGFVVYYMEVAEGTGGTGSDVDLTGYATEEYVDTAIEAARPDLTGYAKTEDIPTKTSDLENNSGFITKADIPTDESYELIGQTPLTLENGGNIKLVADGETNYEMKTPTVWNFEDNFASGDYALTKCALERESDHYKLTADESTTAHHQSYIKILIPVEANKKYTLCWDNSPSKGDVVSSPIDWGGMISVYDTDTSTLIKSGIVLDDLTEYEFTPTTNVLQIRYYPARNNYTPYAGSVLRFGGIWLNEGNSSTELTEIYNASGTFEDVVILQKVPIGTTISSTPTVSVYRKNPTDKTLTQSDVPADAESTGNAIKEIKALLPLYGKTIINFGDSIFGNKQPPNDISTFLAEKTGATVYNCGFGGCRMTPHTSSWYDAFGMYRLAKAITTKDFTLQNEAVASGNLSERYSTGLERLKSIDFSNVDIVTIAYGSNDFNGYGADLDNEENLLDINTFGGALRYSIETLLATYPNLRIFVLSIAYRYWIDDNNEFVDDTNNHANNYGKYTKDYNDKLKAVAEEYNLPYIDDYNISIGKHNRSYYFGTTDPAHHLETGRKLIAEHLAGALTSCVSGGQDGTDGVGIASVEQTTTSSADNGTNVITVTLTDGTTSTFEIRNGSKGSTGASGSSASAIEILSRSGGYWNIQGKWYSDDSTTSISSKYTNIVPVIEGEKYSYTGYGASYGASILWYSDAAGSSLLSYEIYNDGGLTGNAQTVVVTVPAGAKSARFCSYSYGTPVLSIYLYEEETAASALTGKKIVYDGDSICESRTSGTASNGGAYAKIIAELTGGNYTNQAVGGAKLITRTDGGHSVVDNLANLPDGDLYCFEGGVNDVWSSVPLGTYDMADYTGEVDNTTICGALETIFRYALNNFIGKPICFVISHKVSNINYENYKNYHDSAVAICNKYSIPYYDAYNESGLNGWNTVQSNAYLTANSDGTPDGCHPNEEGYKRYYVPQLISLFERIMPRG